MRIKEFFNLDSYSAVAFGIIFFLQLASFLYGFVCVWTGGIFCSVTEWFLLISTFGLISIEFFAAFAIIFAPIGAYIWGCIIGSFFRKN